MNQPKNILVINDNQEILEQIKKRLAQQKYNFTALLSGKEALQELRRQHFDLILIDFHLNHQKDGQKTADFFIPRIKKIKPEIPIIVISATESKISAKRLDVADVGYVNTFFWDNLLQLIEKNLNRNSQ